MIELDAQAQNVFTPYLRDWNLLADGKPIRTHTSYLLPVKRGSTPLMLKVSQAKDESRGGYLMAWWAGEGAAQVYDWTNEAILLERAMGRGSLAEWSQQGQDAAASHIVCRVAAQLHRPRQHALPELIPLQVWFHDLETCVDTYGGILRQAASVANELLATAEDVVVLHGDLHHQNVLDFGERGWLAIDPKALLGERSFDFANIFCNPTQAVATSSDRFARQLSLIASQAQVNPKRLRAWVVAWAGLSAVWSLQDGDEAETALMVAGLAAGELW